MKVIGMKDLIIRIKVMMTCSFWKKGLRVLMIMMGVSRL